MADPKLKLGNDIWATKQKSLLAYNDEGGNFKSLPFQVDRISSGTYVGRNGLIQTAASNEPRVDFLSNTKGALLLEPQRTNLLPESENFSTNWVAIGSSVSNGISSPDGGTNAYSLIEGSASGGKIIYDTISVSAGSVTYSLFMKKGDKRYTALLLSGVVSTSMFNVDLENGTGTIATGSFDNTSIDEYADGWYRVSVTKTTTSGNLNCNVYLMNGATYNDRNYTGNGTDKTYIFGAQLEAETYATSYIPTSGAAVTRVVDGVEYDHFPADFINSTEGTLFVDFEYLFETTSSSSTDSLRDIMVLGTSSDLSEGISIDNYRSQFRVFVQGSGMTTQSIGSNSTGASQPNTRYKLAVKYKTGDCKAYLNGSLLGSTTGTVNFVTDLDGFFFSYNDSSRSFKNQKHVYDLQYFDSALSDAELIELTS